jgi:hypothetical protein
MRHPFDADSKGDITMSAAITTTAKSSALDSTGRFLVFASPLVTGFRGAPLALSASQKTGKRKESTRRNWAKRRAYQA